MTLRCVPTGERPSELHALFRALEHLWREWQLQVNTTRCSAPGSVGPFLLEDYSLVIAPLRMHETHSPALLPKVPIGP